MRITFEPRFGAKMTRECSERTYNIAENNRDE
jgi:hypothetical protein